MKTRQQIVDLGYTVDPSASVMHFLTAHLSEKDISDIRRQIPRKDLIEAWRDIEDHAKELAKRLMGKEAATPSRTWNLLSSARPEMVLFLAVTAKNQSVAQKIKNFFTKWRDVQKRIPLPEMTELLITPQLPEYPKIARDVFMLLLDGKLRSRTETLKFLKPFAPPPPPPPPPPRRGRGPKAAAVAPPAAAEARASQGKVKAKRPRRQSLRPRRCRQWRRLQRIQNRQPCQSQTQNRKPAKARRRNLPSPHPSQSRPGIRQRSPWKKTPSKKPTKVRKR